MAGHSKTFLAIADDLTGAAEIAGIGLRHGLPTRLLRAPPYAMADGLTVIDTDSRGLPPADAAAAMRAVVDGVDTAAADLVYKKIDSVLRGPVLAEVEAALAGLHRGRAVLLPQNPSRGRTIVNGVYSVDGVPLHQTAFANDPEYPASTADVNELIGLAHAKLPITIANAGVATEVSQIVQRLSDDTLPVGGADFFTAILQHRGCHAATHPGTPPRLGTTLFICGSASSQRDQLLARARVERIPVCPMPREVFAVAHASGASAVSGWVDSIVAAMQTAGRCVVAIDQQTDRRPGTAVGLQNTLATLAREVCKHSPPANLMLEGGATASAVCRELQWNQFEVIDEMAVGVVQMQPIGQAHAPMLVVKPGSYAWPDEVWS